MILLIDNYDSFVFNLARYFRELGQETHVVRNDAVTLEQIKESPPAAIVLSPGPCTPDEAGISVDVIRRFAGEIPLLGVCLGHQAIATAFGGNIVRATEPVHGRTSAVSHDAADLFAAIPSPFTATRYHSLIVDEGSLPRELLVIARLDDGTIMALQHREHPVFGVQFHPESILTAGGKRLLSNFLSLAGIASPQESVEATPEFEQPPPSDVILPSPLHW